MRSWCFDSQESGGVYDREYGSADIREVVYKIVGNGLFMDEDTSLQVAVDSGLQVAIQPGNCFINGAFGAVDTAETLTFDSSASGRYDIVVARFDLSLSYRSIRLAVVKGTEGSGTAPTPTQTASVYDLQLAKVNVRAGATSILQSDITDTREDSSVCGIVNGVSSQAAALQEQINDFDINKQDKTDSLATEATIDDADSLPFYDVSISAHKKTLWSNIKAKLKTYFDTLYVKSTKTNLTLTGSSSASVFNGVAEHYATLDKIYLNVGFQLDSTTTANSTVTLGTISGISISGNQDPRLDGVTVDASLNLVPIKVAITSSGNIRMLCETPISYGTIISITGWFTATLT